MQTLTKTKKELTDAQMMRYVSEIKTKYGLEPRKDENKYTAKQLYNHYKGLTFIARAAAAEYLDSCIVESRI